MIRAVVFVAVLGVMTPTWAGEDTSQIKTLTEEQRKMILAVADLKKDVSHLTILDAATAKELAEYKGCLDLSGLKKLDDTTARALAWCKCHELVLNGLYSLSPEVADALAHYKGCLSLNGLTELSPEAAKALARSNNHHDRAKADGKEVPWWELLSFE